MTTVVPGTASAPLVATVASYGLPGSLLDLPTSVLEPRDWRGLLGVVRDQRIVGLLSQAVADGAFPVSEAQREQLAAAGLESAALAVLLERTLLETTELLEQEDVPHRVLKGAALAHTAYADPALRSFGDVDLLVPSDRFDDVIDLLTRAGSTRRWAAPRAGFSTRYGKGACLVNPEGYELDIHRTFVFGPFGLTVELPALFDQATPFVLGGRTLQGLGPAHRFLHACYHAVLGNAPPRLVPLRDVAQLLLGSDLDRRDVLEVAAAWRAEAVVAAAITMTWSTLHLADAVPLSVWASRHVPSPFEERALRAYTDHERSWAGQAVAGLWALPTMSERATYARALLLPDAGYLAARERGYLRRFTRGLRLLARWGH